MAKDPGTPDGVGLVHMPRITPLYPVEYQQVGGFGPMKRSDAFDAIKKAANIGHARPDLVWVQKGDKANDANLEHAIRKAKEKFRVVKEMIKAGDKSNEGWGVYYQFGQIVIVEHTSDPNSVVIDLRDGKEKKLPHFHAEIAPPLDVQRRIAGEVPRAASGRDDWFTVTRVDRMGIRSPFTLDKAKLNHHLYYEALT